MFPDADKPDSCFGALSADYDPVLSCMFNSSVGYRYGESSVVTISTEEFLKGFFDGLDSTQEAIAAAVEKANQMMEDFKIQNR